MTNETQLWEKFLGPDAYEELMEAMFDVDEDKALDILGVACFQAYNRGLRGESLI